jgi:hypothetical protein
MPQNFNSNRQFRSHLEEKKLPKRPIILQFSKPAQKQIENWADLFFPLKFDSKEAATKEVCPHPRYKML